MDRFERLSETERAAVLGPPGTPRVAVEAATPFGWHRWVGERGAVVGMRTFGASGPEADVYAHFGITAATVVEQARALLTA
jgi:transketolase